MKLDEIFHELFMNIFILLDEKCVMKNNYNYSSKKMKNPLFHSTHRNNTPHQHSFIHSSKHVTKMKNYIGGASLSPSQKKARANK
jgi:hypothetical protein